MAERAFDVVVIGAGAPGQAIAVRLGEAGVEVAIVEERLVGGECSFFACMPSKALLRPMEVAAEARRVPGLATVRSTPRRCSHKKRRPHHLDDSTQLPWLEERGVALVRGHGRAAGTRRRRCLQARRAVVLASGSLSDDPTGAGLAEARPWNSAAGWSAWRWRRRGPPGLPRDARAPRRAADRARGAFASAQDTALREGGVDAGLGAEVSAVSLKRRWCTSSSATAGRSTRTRSSSRSGGRRAHRPSGSTRGRA